MTINIVSFERKLSLFRTRSISARADSHLGLLEFYLAVKTPRSYIGYRVFARAAFEWIFSG